MDAGLMENYLVAVTTRKAQADSVDGQLEELTFSLKDFQVKREVNILPMTLFASAPVYLAVRAVGIFVTNVSVSV